MTRQQPHHMAKERRLTATQKIRAVGSRNEAKLANHIGIVLHHTLDNSPVTICRETEHNEITIPIELLAKTAARNDIFVRQSDERTTIATIATLKNCPERGNMLTNSTLSITMKCWCGMFKFVKVTIHKLTQVKIRVVFFDQIFFFDLLHALARNEVDKR